MVTSSGRTYPSLFYRPRDSSVHQGLLEDTGTACHMGQTNCLWNSRRITSRTGEQRYFSFHDTRLNSKLFFSFHIYDYTLYHNIVDNFFPQKLTDGRYIPAAVFLSLRRVAKTDDSSPVVKYLPNFTEGEQQILLVLACQSISPSIHRSIVF